jgi:UDP-glucose 4-epimerase
MYPSNSNRACNLNCVALRYFNAARVTAGLGEDHRPETHLLPRLLDVALNYQGVFEIYGKDYPTPDGACVRDFVHVLDISRAHILALRALSRVKFVGLGKGHSIREVIQKVEEARGKHIPVRYRPRRAGDPAILVASREKICRDLGWQPRNSNLEIIVRSAWQWKRKHPAGYATGKRQ